MSAQRIRAIDLTDHEGSLVYGFPGEGWIRIDRVTQTGTGKHDMTNINGYLGVRNDQHVQVVPGQPDGISFDEVRLPDPAVAAERVREFISEYGDGIYLHTDGIPLYARDLEALARAALKEARR